MFKRNFIKLCSEKGVSPSYVCSQIGISAAAFSQWDDNTIPRKVTQQRIADYFGITVDELLGNDEKAPTPTTASSEDERIKQVLIYLEESGVIEFTGKKEKPAENGELLENTIIWHRDGKTERKQLTKEQMDMIAAMLATLPDTPKDI